MIGDGRKYAFNPIVVNSTMYVLGKNNSIIALDAATGKEFWAHPAEPTPPSSPTAASITGKVTTSAIAVYYSRATTSFAPWTPALASRSCLSETTGVSI